MMWSRHSRRIAPISRSAKPFCQGEAGAVGLSRMPMARNRRVTAAPSDAIPIADEVFWGIIPRKRLGHLTRNPIRGRVCSDIDPDEVSAVEADDHEGVEQAKANGRNNEQIHRGNVRRVVTQERSPFLAWRSTALDHVLGDAGLGHLKPELEKFSVNAWRAPKRIFDAHPPDQRAQVPHDLRPPSQ